ncbi:MAG: ABC transporter permease [Candidatus Atribacteria bacterium]|nr:MAG: ABC transporter permease [Candidatus Atribacteria bacterium]
MRILAGQIALETKLFFRRKDELFWNLAFPMFFMVLYGLIYGNTMWGDILAIEYMFPGIIVMALMVNGIMVSATVFVEERGKGIYRRLSLTPLKRQTIIGAQILHRYIVTLVQTLLLLVVGVFAFKVNIVGNYFFFWLILTFGSLCFLSIGFALATLIRSTRSATPICMIVFFMMLFLGGIFFPTSIMPDFLVVITKALPSTHLNDALRMITIEGAGLGAAWLELLVVGGWFVVSLGLSIKFFRWE